MSIRMSWTMAAMPIASMAVVLAFLPDLERPQSSSVAAQAHTGPATTAPRVWRTTESDPLVAEHRVLEAAQLAVTLPGHLKAVHSDCTDQAVSPAIDSEEAAFCLAVADSILLHRPFDALPDQATNGPGSPG